MQDRPVSSVEKPPRGRGQKAGRPAKRPKMTVAGTRVVAMEMVEVVGVRLHVEGGPSEVSGRIACGVWGEEESR